MIRAELAIGSTERTLDVAERGVDPLEGHHAGCLAARAGAGRPMVMAGTAEGGPAGEAVGHDLGVGGRPALCAACGLALAEAPDRSRIDLARLVLGVGQDRSHERRLAGRASAPLAARTHRAGRGPSPQR